LKEQFELIFETSPDSALITRVSDGLFFDCNEEFTKISGYTKADLLNKTVIDINLWKNVEERKKMVKILYDKGICENFEASFRMKDNSLITGLISAKVMILRGEPYIFSVTRDISEQKVARERESEYLSELKELNTIKDKLFSILGHDLRSPFSTVLGFSGELREGAKLYSFDEIESLAGEIQKSGETALALLENILSWARSQTGQIKILWVRTDLNAVIQDVVNQSSLQAMSKGILIIFQPHSAFIFETDENILRTILRNLLSNAIKFTKPGGNITVRTNATDSFIEVSVADNGIGMTKEFAGNLFSDIVNPTTYGTNNEKGTGLGLAICKELVERIGGTINAKSEPDNGSTFTFTLPLHPSIY
jgi:PAS domain S-box-containing protein